MHEYFDLCDPRGRPTGRTKPRALVHRDGDWHRSFHCWVVTASDEGPAVILQRRSFQKETWAGLWDVSVAGHYSAGEGVEGGLREIREELGLIVQQDELLHVAWRREEVFYPDGLIEREVQDVFFLRRDVDLPTLDPAPDEVIGLVLTPVDALDALARGALVSCAVLGRRIGPRNASVETIELQPADLVPRAHDYYGKVTRFAARFARERPTIRRRRWW